MTKKRLLTYLVVAFIVGIGCTFAFTTFAGSGWYGIKSSLGLGGEAIFLEDSNFGGPKADIPEFEGSESFPTNNHQVILAQNIERKIIPVPYGGRVVVVNLDQMKVFLYEDGETVDEFIIQSKPVENSLWDSPPGEYSVQYKTKEYFSPVADVWMPYTVQFFNDYYVHGWPYYTGGTLVDEEFLAGAIRLLTADAKKVYDFTKIGSRIIVVSSVPSKFQNREITGDYIKKDDGANIPNTDARAYIISDIDTGQVVLEKNSDRVYPIASITKLMTALVSLEVFNQLEDTQISYGAVATRGDQGHLSAGEKWALGELLYPLLLESSNDAAEAIAEHGNREEFMEAMNGMAKTIGMSTATFNDPSGLSVGNAATAKDLARLAEYVYNYKSYIFNVAQEKRHSIDGTTWYNNNPYKNDKEWLGGKNGLTTAAGHTLLTVLRTNLSNGETRNLVFVVLKSEDEDRDTRILQSYIERHVEFVPFEK